MFFGSWADPFLVHTLAFSLLWQGYLGSRPFVAHSRVPIWPSDSSCWWVVYSLWCSFDISALSGFFEWLIMVPSLLPCGGCCCHWLFFFFLHRTHNVSFINCREGEEITEFSLEVYLGKLALLKCCHGNSVEHERCEREAELKDVDSWISLFLFAVSFQHRWTIL